MNNLLFNEINCFKLENKIDIIVKILYVYNIISHLRFLSVRDARRISH